jgi:hypothetical protein
MADIGVMHVFTYTCPDDVDYCVMCKPFAERLSTHEGHEWATFESFVEEG